MTFFSTDRCRIESVPENGYVEDLQSSRRLTQGALVEQLALILYKCESGLPPIGENNNICFKGNWQKEVPKCEATCDTALIRGISISSLCEIDDAQTACSGLVKNGTRAVLTCQKGYDRGDAEEQISHCDVDKDWWPRPQACTPICGILNSQEEFEFGRHHLPSYSVVPWHVGIYIQFSGKTEFRYACGGTILNPKFIIAAMHCFVGADDGMPFDISLFRIVAGELRSRQLDETYSGNDNQTFHVQEILNGGFKSVYTRVNNIALVILKTRIIFSDSVAPICIEYGEKDYAPAGQNGVYFGYERYPTDESLPTLDALVVPILSQIECKQKAHESFLGCILPETICTGPLNNTDLGYCNADNGCGLTVARKIGERTVYFLHGLQSVVSGHDDECNPNVFAASVSVHYFKDFISLAHGYQYL